jgi:heme-degrading monooxygenase HmoA
MSKGENMMSSIAKTPKPPYYAVIFVSERTDEDQGYQEMAGKMEELAQEIPGFLGIESARGSDGFGITVSYWESEEAIRKWKEHSLHQVAQERGRMEWYLRFKTRVCKVYREKEYERKEKA